MKNLLLISMLICCSFGFAQKSDQKDSIVLRERLDTMNYSVYFDRNHFDLIDIEKKNLDEFLKKNGLLDIKSILINGHTDTDGSDIFNDTLSRRRCETVLKIANTLKPGFQIEMKPYGEKKLFKTESTKEDQALI